MGGRLGSDLSNTGRGRDALAQATKILDKLGVTLNREKTRIVHISKGFEFLGFKIQQGRNRFKRPATGSNPG